MTLERLNEWRTVVWLSVAVVAIASLQLAFAHSTQAGVLSVVALVSVGPFALLGIDHAIDS